MAPQLRLALLRLSRIERAKSFAQRALRGLAGFAKALKVTYNDIEVGFDFEPEPGLADNGDLELIAKGMIWSPSHGDTTFTVPLFDEFMKRIMPGADWKTA
ncbi:MAG TPA: hypothetical protein VIG99_31460 [Myxococcaceae bacterium]